VNLTVDQAIQIALANRLDLKNFLAAVTDTWRNVEVDANALRGILNFVYNANLASAPDHATLFRFDSSASIQQFRFQFQAPINRRAERNQYRIDQIQYQRARRAYMLLRDRIVQQIRLDMRELTLNRKQFDIGREQTLSSSIQVEQAEDALLLPAEGGAPVTLNLLNALNALLTARNQLIDISGYELKPGMTAEARILVGELHNVLVVPVQAITEHKGEFYAFVDEPGGIKLRKVKIGENNEKLVEVLDGLKEGESVALDARIRAAEFKSDETKESPKEGPKSEAPSPQVK